MRDIKLDKDWKIIITENSSTIAKLNKRLTEMEEREKELIRNVAFTQNFIRDELPSHFVTAALNYTSKGTEAERKNETSKLLSEYGDRFHKIFSTQLNRQWSASAPPNHLLYDYLEVLKDKEICT